MTFPRIDIPYNVTPIPSTFNEGLSYYETVSKLIYIVNQMIDYINTGTLPTPKGFVTKEDLEKLLEMKLSLENYLDDIKNKRKLDENGNFTGTWFGITDPSKIMKDHKITYKTVSTTLTDSYTPDDYIFKHLQMQGMDCALCVMVNISGDTDSNPIKMDNGRITTALLNAKNRGVKVQMLKPHLGTNWSDNYYRNGFNPTSRDTFFRNWKAILMDYAKICNDNKIPILCMSCEMTQITKNDTLSYWSDIVNSIKGLYPNLLLTNAPRQWEIADTNYKDIWNLSDIIGGNVYLSYSNKDYKGDEMSAEFIAESFYQDMTQYTLIPNINKICSQFNKPFLITEIGCMPYSDGYVQVRSTQEFKNYNVPNKLGLALLKYLCLNENICGFSWWHTNSPFEYFSDDSIMPLEETFINFVKGGLI